ncbi:hypothetical protein M378DRAFT_178512 [Amanita muscaria Koide BX008]|uniref:Uncharacterized protein n=1 Tax=Amanita muscaria (strain Koide BX008) TaxID=946122 RepID=A0A0C2X8T2_AMAMK|nr:hypothetical protein M378DRAFT_178512 [Amanita muscaria Koide BX008]
MHSHSVPAFAPDDTSVNMVVGGSPPYVFSPEVIMPYVKARPGVDIDLDDHKCFSLRYVAHVDDGAGAGPLSYPNKDKLLHANIPVKILVPHITLKAVRDIAKIHGIALDRKAQDKRERICELFENHVCSKCVIFSSVFAIRVVNKSNYKQATVEKESDSRRDAEKQQREQKTEFPPRPLGDYLAHGILRDFCNDLSPEVFEEAGCA